MSDTDTSTSRRDAIKKAAAAAATAGIVWSAPRVEGLSLRPNYAAASSTTIDWTAQLNMLGQSGAIQGLDASAAVNDAIAFARSSVVVGFGIVAAANGTGLAAANLTITGISSPGGPIDFNPNNDFAFTNVVSTQVGVDPAPTFPLQLRGTFTCV